MCAGMMSWQTGGIGRWSFSFAPENIHCRQGSTRGKSKAMISSQTTLWLYNALKHSYLPLITRVPRFFWVTDSLSLNSHQGYPPSDPITPGKLESVFLCFCIYHAPALPMVPEHPKMWTPACSRCGFKKKGDNYQWQSEYKRRRSW